MAWKNPFVWAAVLICVMFGSYVMADGVKNTLQAKLYLVTPPGSTCSLTYQYAKTTLSVPCNENKQITSSPIQFELGGDLATLLQKYDEVKVTMKMEQLVSPNQKIITHTIKKQGEHRYTCDNEVILDNTFAFYFRANEKGINCQAV